MFVTRKAVRQKLLQAAVLEKGEEASARVLRSEWTAPYSSTRPLRASSAPALRSSSVRSADVRDSESWEPFDYAPVSIQQMVTSAGAGSPITSR